MARLIRTEKEVEGRYTEQWLVVEEDALDQWPRGPREIVGRPAAKVDGRERATGKARYTADVRLPGMLHSALLRSPHAHARVARIDLSKALEAPRRPRRPRARRDPAARRGGRLLRRARSRPSAPRATAPPAPPSSSSTSSGSSSRRSSTRTRPSAAAPS